MKKQTPFIRLRMAVAAFAGIMILLSLFAFTARKKMIDDLWLQLGMNKDQGMNGIKKSFLNGNLHYYGARNIKNIATGNRVEVAKDLLTTAKEYINSDAFKKEYEQMRQNSKPQEPVTIVRTKEQIRKEEIAKAEKGIKDTEEAMKKSTPELAESLKEVVTMYKQNLADYKDPNNQMIDYYYQSDVFNAEKAAKDYKDQLAKWSGNYPEDYRQMIKARLQQFLKVAATVDFSAQLKESYGKQRFVNPAYESKPAEWKQIFRTGKDVTEFTKKFAAQWLAELK
jgi:protein-tyrosine-phosphatase